jgi:hypothetical protein
VGGGTSVQEGLEMGLWDKIKSTDIITCNNAILHIPYAPKYATWLDSTDKDPTVIKKILETPCIRVTQQHHEECDDSKVIRFNIHHKPELFYNGIEQGALFVGKRMFTGVFALSLAIYIGYKRIFLLGFDWSGKGEWWGYGTNPSVFLKDVKKKKVQDDVGEHHDVFKGKAEIWNVSPNSNIPSFPKITYGKFFTMLQGDDYGDKKKAGRDLRSALQPDLCAVR